MKLNYILGTLILIATPAFGGDAKAGKAKAAMCMSCHGTNGIGTSDLYPNLAGQKEKYLVKQLKAFKSGERKDGTMQGMTAALSEKDMEDIAAFFSSLK